MTIDARNPEGKALSPADRSRMIGEALRQAARVSRFSNPNKTTIRTIRAHRRRDIVTPLLCLFLFVIPSLGSAVFFGFYLSDRYVTDARFALRPAIGGAEKATPDSVGTTSSIPAQMIAQDSMIVGEYIKSRTMVETLERSLPLRRMFSRDDIDQYSRFDPAKPIEKLVKYWADRVKVSVESSGLIEVSVNAFDPDDSLTLNKAVLAESERLVNQLTERARTDALAESEREMKRAEARLMKVQLAVRDLRNRDGVLDAQKSNDTNLKMVAEIRTQRINLAVKLSLLQRDLRDDSRSVQDLKAQIAQLDDTIARIEREAANQDPEQRRVLSATLTKFEELDAERKNAEKYYAATIAARERSRMIADRQIEFFSMIVEPVRAESAQEPRRTLFIAISVAVSALAFGLSLLARKALA
ncbi:capsule biosynthesis protein [Methylobacterium indicum]|uniref:Capsule biosynthesis protein n=1 Tax=Methylobacterium indicum TaxID=1775910 RepID=A0ABR5GWA3_9HYPH|nr:capsule biosynthesis protein [Methylobacterium indicum]KMO12524.1 capsule biosynthesis protein [Methylobacterium indicum]KMO14154.1 capsule biosynthesis protein [Methylobacterium indicum]